MRHIKPIFEANVNQDDLLDIKDMFWDLSDKWNISEDDSWENDLKDYYFIKLDPSSWVNWGAVNKSIRNDHGYITRHRIILTVRMGSLSYEKRPDDGGWRPTILEKNRKETHNKKIKFKGEIRQFIKKLIGMGYMVEYSFDPGYLGYVIYIYTLK